MSEILKEETEYYWMELFDENHEIYGEYIEDFQKVINKRIKSKDMFGGFFTEESRLNKPEKFIFDISGSKYGYAPFDKGFSDIAYLINGVEIKKNDKGVETLSMRIVLLNHTLSIQSKYLSELIENDINIEFVFIGMFNDVNYLDLIINNISMVGDYSTSLDRRKKIAKLLNE